MNELWKTKACEVAVIKFEAEDSYWFAPPTRWQHAEARALCGSCFVQAECQANQVHVVRWSADESRRERKGGKRCAALHASERSRA